MPKQQKRNFPNTIKYLNKEEWDTFRACIDNYRDKLMVLVLYSTGMRVGEFTKSKIQDIDFQERFLSIPAENTKTRVGRTVWISPETLSEIKAYIKLTKKKSGRLFDLTPRRVQQLIKQYSKISGVKVTPHTLRHTHIVHALMKRVPITAVQKQVGHKRLATTQIYSDFAPEQVREAYERQV
ncbi:MAG TPA: site-specific integrase [bacterium]|nr:site-specific integrase [bacterium]